MDVHARFEVELLNNLYYMRTVMDTLGSSLIGRSMSQPEYSAYDRNLQHMQITPVTSAQEHLGYITSNMALLKLAMSRANKSDERRLYIIWIVWDKFRQLMLRIKGIVSGDPRRVDIEVMFFIETGDPEAFWRAMWGVATTFHPPETSDGHGEFVTWLINRILPAVMNAESFESGTRDICRSAFEKSLRDSEHARQPMDSVNRLLVATGIWNAPSRGDASADVRAMAPARGRVPVHVARAAVMRGPPMYASPSLSQPMHE